MFDNDTTDATVSRRNVLKTTGGLLAGSAGFASLGAGTAAAEKEEGLQVELREMTEAYIAVEVRFPDDYSFDGSHPILLGHAERFEIHEDERAVSLPDDAEGLANPVEIERLDEETYAMYFRTEGVGRPEIEGDEVTLGLGLFPERTIPIKYWNTCPGHRDYTPGSGAA